MSQNAVTQSLATKADVSANTAVADNLATLSGTVTAHTADSVAHVTQADKNTWNTVGNKVDSTTYASDKNALSGAISANTAAIATLNGSGAGSVQKTVDDAIAAVVADAPASFDTLKEIADWIQSDTTRSRCNELQDYFEQWRHSDA